MKIPQAVAYILLASALACPVCSAQEQPGQPKAGGGTLTRTADSIQRLLNEFLSKVDDPAMHERFWADDLVYTGASGKVRTKQEIVNSVRAEAQNAQKNTSKPDSYTAEDVNIRDFGNVAILNFRLVSHTSDGKTNYYRNSGVFMQRNGQWQVVNWQATKIDKLDQAQTDPAKK